MSAEVEVHVDINWQPAFDVRQAGRASLHQAAETLLNAANADCPVATGRLRDSGQVTQDGGMFFVSYNTPYALAVHERIQVKHPRGHAKWLERASVEHETETVQRVTEAVAKASQ